MTAAFTGLGGGVLFWFLFVYIFVLTLLMSLHRVETVMCSTDAKEHDGEEGRIG